MNKTKENVFEQKKRPPNFRVLKSCSSCDNVDRKDTDLGRFYSCKKYKTNVEDYCLCDDHQMD